MLGVVLDFAKLSLLLKLGVQDKSIASHFGDVEHIDLCGILLHDLHVVEETLRDRDGIVFCVRNYEHAKTASQPIEKSLKHSNKDKSSRILHSFIP